MIAAGLAIALSAGCGSLPGEEGVLDQLDMVLDTNNNGFPDVPTPEGVDKEGTVAIALVNHITLAEAEALAQVEIPDFVTGIIPVYADLIVDVTYPGGITDELTGTRPLGPFEMSLELVCPEAVELLVSINASIPLVGEQTFMTLGPYLFEQDSVARRLSCNSIIRAEASLDERGQPQLSLDVEPM
jgi:hypothetical protein